MEVVGKMGVHLDGSMGVGVSRLEVIMGSNGRLQRTKTDRARIAVESMTPGVTVADVARKRTRVRGEVFLPTRDVPSQCKIGRLIACSTASSIRMTDLRLTW